MKKLSAILLSCALGFTVACEEDDDPNVGSDAGNNTTNNTATDMGGNNSSVDMGGGNNSMVDMGGNNSTTDMGGGGTDAGADMGVDMAPASPWTLSSHTCVGNRTDALWCDDAMNCFVSCGTTTTGTGLHMTTDGGLTWSEPTTNPAGVLTGARINTISRSEAAGPLFVGGDLPNSAGVIGMSDTGALTEVFTRGNMVDNSFTVGSFRRAANGFAIAESLTGSSIVHREMDGGDPTDSWASGSGFWSDGDADDDNFGVQILDMEVFNGQFWGVGSTISQPPTVFTPKWTAGDFDFNIVKLAATGLGAFDGELWGLDVNADGASVGGVNQDLDNGIIYSIASGGADATDPSQWTMFDTSTIFAGSSTWVTDVCRASNNVVYATGRESAEGWGFVLKSDDGGATFSDITPYDSMGNSLFDDVSRCQSFDDGVIIAGAGGLFARYF